MTLSLQDLAAALVALAAALTALVMRWELSRECLVT